jgi:hypothetical protein
VLVADDAIRPMLIVDATWWFLWVLLASARGQEAWSPA